MYKTQIFPTILILLDIGTAIIYVVEGNWRLALYWVAAAVLTLTVTLGDNS